jgi:murein DD-endopeptidase MepM/ murein hydrolase activator NlpD
VQEGAPVSEGTVIGLSGNTGCSGTPHLHFGVARSIDGNVDGNWVLIDPYGWHARRAIRGRSTRAARRACGSGKTERLAQGGPHIILENAQVGYRAAVADSAERQYTSSLRIEGEAHPPHLQPG